MSDGMISRDGARAEVQPPGDLVVATLDSVRTTMRELVNDGVRELVVDLANTKMVDSSGLGLLAATHNSLEKVGGHLAVVHVSKEIFELFTAVRMHQHFSISKD